MKLDEILQQAGRHKARKRVGRGEASGLGKTSGRGNKGAGQRSGSTLILGFEGGQNPILARIPKRGFSNVQFRTVYQVVNLGDLDGRFEANADVDAQALFRARLIEDPAKPVKVLAKGELTKPLKVSAQKFSKAAAEKIAAAGGAANEV